MTPGEKQIIRDLLEFVEFLWNDRQVLRVKARAFDAVTFHLIEHQPMSDFVVCQDYRVAAAKDILAKGDRP